MAAGVLAYRPRELRGSDRADRDGSDRAGLRRVQSAMSRQDSDEAMGTSMAIVCRSAVGAEMGMARAEMLRGWPGYRADCSEPVQAAVAGRAGRSNGCAQIRAKWSRLQAMRVQCAAGMVPSR